MAKARVCPPNAKRHSNELNYDTVVGGRRVARTSAAHIFSFCLLKSCLYHSINSVGSTNIRGEAEIGRDGERETAREKTSNA